MINIINFNFFNW